MKRLTDLRVLKAELLTRGARTTPLLPVSEALNGLLSPPGLMGNMLIVVLDRRLELRRRPRVFRLVMKLCERPTKTVLRPTRVNRLLLKKLAPDPWLLMRRAMVLDRLSSLPRAL